MFSTRRILSSLFWIKKTLSMAAWYAIQSRRLGRIGLRAVDEPLGTDLTSEVVVSGEVDAQVMGNYELSLYVEDESGRSSQETLIVQVADKTSPEISFRMKNRLIISWGYLS